MLVHGHPVREVVTHESSLDQEAREGKRLSRACFLCSWNRLQVRDQALRNGIPFINLDDHSVSIHKKRDGKGHIASSVMKVPINDVVDSGDILVRHEHWK